MTLTVSQVGDILSRRSYRPGWIFNVYAGDTTRLVIIEILATVEDSYNPGQGVPLEVYSEVPDYLTDEGGFDAWFAWRLQRLERHESQEWYRKPGQERPWVPVFNPHRDGADRDVWPIEKRTRPEPAPWTPVGAPPPVDGRRSSIPASRCADPTCPVCTAMFAKEE